MVSACRDLMNESTTGSPASLDAAGGRVDCFTGCLRVFDTAPTTAATAAERGNDHVEASL